jgi:hypothetical protein
LSEGQAEAENVSTPRDNFEQRLNSGDVVEVPEGDHLRPTVLVNPSERRRDWIDVVLRVLAGLALALVVALLAAFLLLTVSLLGSLNAATASFNQATQSLQNLGTTLQQPLQGLLGQVQPDRPPPAAVSQGPEFAQLQRVPVGGEVGRTGTYVVTLGSIARRDGATDPNQAQYAALHRKLLTPRQRTVGPIVVGEDWAEADYNVYKGEEFRLGASYYQVNWVSAEENAAGIALYRSTSSPSAPVKFQLD